jgi:hypothetical protein
MASMIRKKPLDAERYIDAAEVSATLALAAPLAELTPPRPRCCHDAACAVRSQRGFIPRTSGSVPGSASLLSRYYHANLTLSAACSLYARTSA